MVNKELVKKLKELKACEDAVKWVGDKSLETAWNECERADWMLWFICKIEIGTQKERIHVICDCAATALKYVPKGEDRPKNAILAARRYVDKPTTENLEKLIAARAAARAAWAAAGAAWDAAGAAWDATGAARDAAGAAWAAAGAARAAAGAAAKATAGAAWDAAHKKMCELIREKIKI